MATPINHPSSTEGLRGVLTALGWSRTADQTEADTVQQTVKDNQGNDVGILLRINGRPGLFVRSSEEPLTDPSEVYESLLWGWNLEAWFTAVPWSAESLRVYISTYKPDKESILRGAERPVAELKLADVLDIDRAQQMTGQLLLLSPDTWRSQDYEQFLRSPTARRRLTVDEALLTDLQDWRLALVRNLRERHSEVSPQELDAAAQHILDEIIFMRFCEDRRLTNLEPVFNVVASAKGKQVLDRFQALVGAYEALFDTSLFDSTIIEEIPPSPTVLQAIIAQAVEFYKFEVLDIELLGRIYEEYLSYELKHGQRGLFYEFELERRKRQGIFYTPSYIVEYLVARAFRVFEDTNHRSASSTLDPACGSGAFLTRLFEELLQKRDQGMTLSQKRALLEESVYGIDLDERAVRRAAQALYYTLLADETGLSGQHILPELIGNNLLIKNSLLHRQQLVPDQQFDIIVSNPPYRRISGAERDQYVEVYGDLIFGRPDLCWLMLVAAIDNLADGGIVAFIVPDNLLRTKEYRSVREYILNTVRIVEISYINYQAFETTALQNVLLILQREACEEIRRTNPIQVNYYATPGVFEREAGDEIPQAGFYDEDLDYVFNVQLTAPVRAVYEKLKAQSETMEEHFEVRQGIIPNREDLHQVPISRNCRKYLLGKDVRPYVPSWSGTYIDYDLEKASQEPNVWLRDPDLFEVPAKLIVRKIVGDYLVVALDSEQFYVDSASDILVPENKLSENAIYLTLALLSSRLAKFYYLVEYPERKTAFPQIRVMDIERLPFPSAALRMNESVVASIVAATKSLYSDVQRGRIRASAIHETCRAKQIDDLLLELYELTETESNLVDSYLEW